MKKILLIMLTLSLFMSVELDAKGKKIIIKGYVKSETGKPIENATVEIKKILFKNKTVEIKSNKYITNTDNKGFYQIFFEYPTKKIIPNTQLTIICKKDYYQGHAKVVAIKNFKYKLLNFRLTKAKIKKPKINIVVDNDLKSSNDKELELLDTIEETSYDPFESTQLKTAKPGIKRFMPASETYNTEEYSPIEESDFLTSIKTPLSTFGADVDAASYSNMRRFIMKDQLPHKDVIRSEELINYFDYDYEKPKGENPLGINIEYGDCPWNKNNKLVQIGLKGEEIAKEKQKPSNLVFLIDTSGSMNSPKKLPLLKKSFKLLVKNLKNEDRVSIVVYANATGVVLPSTRASEKEKIIQALENLRAGGSTAGGAGIKLAYKIAKQNFIPEGNNRIILATDGDFNIGISNTAQLVNYIKEKKEDGIFLTALGFGMGNYKDGRLQNLADNGNGNHAYIDNLLEAKKVFVNEIGATLYTIAKDVKIQVEFNPGKVYKYRLIGYENRRLNDEDFEDDTKDAGEIGSGHTVTALYEIIPTNKENLEKVNNLKYQNMKIKDEFIKSNEILTVKIRYKEPDGKKSKEFQKILKTKPKKLSKTSNNFRFSSAVAEFAMLLRDSDFKADSNMKNVIKRAKASKGKDHFGYRAEFISLIERAEILLEN